MEHIEGKLLIYEWFKKEMIEVELEAYLPELNQRPDLLIHYGEASIAIEYQCSPISKDVIRARTDGYARNNLDVFWILGKKLRVKNSLNSRHYEYLSLHTDGTYRMFQLNDQELEVIADIKSTATGVSFTKRLISFTDNINSLTNICSLQSKNRHHYNGRREQERKLNQLSFYKDNRARRLFELLYLNGLTVKTMPEAAFYSVSKEWFIKTLPCQWKLIAVLWLENFRSYQIITINGLSRKLRVWKKEEEIIYYFLPDADEKVRLQPFLEFMEILCDKGYLTEVRKHKWQRRRTLL